MKINDTNNNGLLLRFPVFRETLPCDTLIAINGLVSNVLYAEINTRTKRGVSNHQSMRRLASFYYSAPTAWLGLNNVRTSSRGSLQLRQRHLPVIDADRQLHLDFSQSITPQLGFTNKWYSGNVAPLTRLDCRAYAWDHFFLFKFRFYFLLFTFIRNSNSVITLSGLYQSLCLWTNSLFLFQLPCRFIVIATDRPTDPESTRSWQFFRLEICARQQRADKQFFDKMNNEQ